jgi:hypothetical protein
VLLKSGPNQLAFQQKGFAAREFFSHRAALIRKQYPDTYLLLEGRGMTPGQLLSCHFWQLNLYSEDIAGFPDELFTDHAVNWHNQQLGIKGLIAAAGICLQGSDLLVTVMQSDLCQQLYRHPALKAECKTQVDKRFGAWYKLLFNAILDLALDLHAGAVYVPTADWILQATKKFVYPELFRRIYDLPGSYTARRIRRGTAEYWEIPLSANAGRVVPLVEATPQVERNERLICIFHDTEENADTAVTAGECRESLTRMLRCEQAAGARTTYTVVGHLFAAKQREILAAGPHALGFHSYNHALEEYDQLPRCRRVDLQVRGYRPPQSLMTPELTDYNLSYFNFEWLASSPRKPAPAPAFPQSQDGVLESGIVKIPIDTDDYCLATGQLTYRDWRSRLLEQAAGRPLIAFGLHDCYARHWLGSYPELLDSLAQLGRFVTADELCDLTLRRQG